MRSSKSLLRSWLPRGRVARRTRGVVLGGVWLRCVTHWRARELDRRLAAGADPLASDELSLRVGQLGSTMTTMRLAAALRDAVEVANGHHAPLVPTRLRRGAVRESEELLLALSERVREGGPLGVRGLALVSQLVQRRTSPLYSEDVRPPLAAVASEALVELDRGIRTASATQPQFHR